MMMRDVLDQPGTDRRRERDSDAVLLARADGDPGAFAELVRRHTDGIFRFVASRIGPSAAEDVVAEVFIAAFDHRERFDSSRGDLRGWLFGFASVQLRRHAVAEYRWLQKSMAATHDVESGGIGSEGHEQRTIERADAARLAPELAEALLSLTPAERDVLLLFALEELTHEQIARVLGIRRGTAKTRLSRGCARLREHLGAAHQSAAGDRSES